MKRRIAFAGILLAGGLVAATWLRPTDREREPLHLAGSHVPATGSAAVTDPSPLTASTPLTAPAPAPVTAASAASAALADDVHPDPVVALKAALAGGDDLELVVAVEAAVEAHATDALATLASVDLKAAPHSAPAVIQGIATLAKDAGPRERKEAASTLARWFREERGREGLDAAGNTTTLIDALADTGHREAVDALVAALDEHTLPLHNETLVVQRLAELRQTAARPGVARFQARVAALPAAEGIDEELRREAMAAARDALEKLGG